MEPRLGYKHVFITHILENETIGAAKSYELVVKLGRRRQFDHF